MNQMQFDPQMNDFNNNQMQMNQMNMMNQMNQMNQINMMNQMNQMNMMNQMNQMNQMSQIPMENMVMNQLMLMANIASQMQNINQIQNNQPQWPDGLTLRFTIDDGRNTLVIIPCRYSERMGDVIERFWMRIGYRDPQAKFIHNAKNITPTLTIAEAGLVNQNMIQVLLLGRVKGA